jgi:hypothetical protein
MILDVRSKRDVTRARRRAGVEREDGAVHTEIEEELV